MLQAPAYNVLRMPRPLLPAQAQVQLELCRALQAGASAAVCAPSWLQVLTMWSRGTDMAQADTPAFALHLWTRVQPLVRAAACIPISNFERNLCLLQATEGHRISRKSSKLGQNCSSQASGHTCCQ